MRRISIFVSALAILSFMQATAQIESDQINMDFVVSDEELAMLFAAFIAAVAGIGIFLARDIILRKKTSYDSEELESKKDRTYEKYHSDWGDDYEELGARKNTIKDREFLKDLQNSELPDYYKILELPRDATHEEIKQQYRKLAKKSHPDKTKDKEAKDVMSEINKAYEILSDRELKSKYDRHLD